MANIEQLAQITFWTACALMLMNYIGIYIFLQIISIFPRKDKFQTSDSGLHYELPTVTVLVAARNEEGVIGNKVKNTLGQDYPEEKIRIIIASDNSTDSTADIVNSFSDNRVELLEMQTRSGKLGIIDQVIPTLESEIVLITDANVMLKPDSIRQIMYKYADPKVGAVSGNQLSISAAGSKQMDHEETYRNFETTLKRVMGKLGLVIGCYGGIYSIRKDLFRPIGSVPMNDDMILPLEVMGQGYKVDFAERGQALEETEKSIEQEYNRRKRIIKYNIPIIPRGIKLTAKAGILPLFLFIFYKVVRWISPVLFILITASSMTLALSSNTFLVLSSVILFGFLLSLLGFVANRRGLQIKMVSSLYYFVSMNIAVLRGMFGLNIKTKHHWEPRG